MRSSNPRFRAYVGIERSLQDRAIRSGAVGAAGDPLDEHFVHLSRVLGAHLMAPNMDEVFNLFALAIRRGLTADDLKSPMFAYPTGASDIGYML